MLKCLNNIEVSLTWQWFCVGKNLCSAGLVKFVVWRWRSFVMSSLTAKVWEVHIRKWTLTHSFAFESVNTNTICLLTTVVKTHMLMDFNREIMEETLKSLNTGAKVYVRCSIAIWGIVLQKAEAAKSLAGDILTTKSVRIQTEYMRRRKTKVPLHRIPLFIPEDHLGFFFSRSG